MATHRYQAVVEWKRSGQNFLDHQYYRDHRWAFDGGIEISASASRLIVAITVVTLRPVVEFSGN
jgi:hypothetical protein